MTLESSLRAKREKGRKLLVGYLMGGDSADWMASLEAMADAGLDAVEVGIPFSDPVMDGPVIQEASRRALELGSTPASILGELSKASLKVPVVAMTYYNLAFHVGEEVFATQLADAGIAGAILADLPVEESGSWRQAARSRGLDTVMLAAPTSTPERLRRICEAASGFIYGVGVMGVTGERQALASSAMEVARRLKTITDLPVLIGVGVSTPDQAARLVEVADGVGVGSAFVRRHLEGASPEELAKLVASFREALDS